MSNMTTIILMEKNDKGEFEPKNILQFNARHWRRMSRQKASKVKIPMGWPSAFTVSLETWSSGPTSWQVIGTLAGLGLIFGLLLAVTVML